MQAHPLINDTPPKGVRAPIHLIPASATRYKLPLNSRIPAHNNQPALTAHGLLVSRSNQATTKRPRAWYIW